MRLLGAGAAMVVGVGLAWAASGCGPAGPEAPVQPVPFSHRIHAGENAMGCTMCHVYAPHSPVAGIPSLERCNGCHRFVAGDKPVIQALNQAFADKKPIEWNRVYRLPDHVYFTHERHVAAGVRCQSCHGEVETMDVVRQVPPLTMGWCLDCHHLRSAPTDCWTCHK